MKASKNDLMEKCIDDCLDCYRVCTEAAAHCLKNGGKHAEPEHMTIMNSCAQACHISASFLLSNSEFSSRMCSLCAKVCDKCADSCEKFEDDFMKECAETCRECVNSCKDMEKY